MQTFDVDEAGRLIGDVRGTRLFIPVLLALTCGLRRGEIMALKWANVDLDNATLRVVESMEQTRRDGIRLKRPKSGRGRLIDLPKLAVTELRKHRAQQESEFELLGAKLTRDSFVYAHEDGTPIKPDSFSRSWNHWFKKRKSQVRFHDLRHTHATHLLEQGVHPKVAQERLGHSSISITMDIYSHVLPGMGAEAAKKVGDALSAAVAKNSGVEQKAD